MKHFMSNPQRILDAPRFVITPTKENRFDHNDAASNSDSIIYLENPFTKEVADDLNSKGHDCKIMPLHAAAIFGRAQIIFSRVDPRSGIRVLCGGSEPRTDGQAIGW
jgi:gamma-glutamyltranspeptidase/glutathione hydrolase